MSAPRPDPGEPIDIIADIRFGLEVVKLHRQPARVLFEMLKELGRDRLIRTDLEQRVRRYARLDPRALAFTGGDRMVAAPLYLAGDEP
jgi:hypothetical protein